METPQKHFANRFRKITGKDILKLLDDGKIYSKECYIRNRDKLKEYIRKQLEKNDEKS